MVQKVLLGPNKVKPAEVRSLRFAAPPFTPTALLPYSPSPSSHPHPSPQAEEFLSYVPFWPSSPSNGLEEWGNPAAPEKGDIHYWGVWHGAQGFQKYLEIKV